MAHSTGLTVDTTLPLQWTGVKERIPGVDLRISILLQNTVAHFLDTLPSPLFVFLARSLLFLTQYITLMLLVRLERCVQRFGEELGIELRENGYNTNQFNE